MLIQDPQLERIYTYKAPPWRTWFIKFRSTFLQPKWLWSLVIGNSLYQEVLDPAKFAKPSLRWRVQSVLEMPVFRKLCLGLWPTICSTKAWAQADVGGESDPSYYRESGTHVDTLCDLVARYANSRDAPILDLGCNCGRHLNQLLSMGFVNLHGVDFSARALDLMAEWFPATKGKVTSHHDFFQRYLTTVPDSFFDIIYTHTVTVEATHPSFNLVKEIARATRRHAILLIHENDGWTRFWEYEFRRQDFVLTFLMRPIYQSTAPDLSPKASGNPTLFVFTRKNVEVPYPGVGSHGGGDLSWS